MANSHVFRRESWSLLCPFWIILTEYVLCTSLVPRFRFAIFVEFTNLFRLCRFQNLILVWLLLTRSVLSLNVELHKWWGVFNCYFILNSLLSQVFFIQFNILVSCSLRLLLVQIWEHYRSVSSYRSVTRGVGHLWFTFTFEKIEFTVSDWWNFWSFQRVLWLFNLLSHPYFSLDLLVLEFIIRFRGANGTYFAIWLGIIFELSIDKVISFEESLLLLIKCVLRLILVEVTVPYTEFTKQLGNIDVFNLQGFEISVNLMSTNSVE